MKLICISTKVYVHPWDEEDDFSHNKLWKYLTLNKEYNCIDIIYNDDGDPEEYKIIADDEREGQYPICNFSTRWEIREGKLNELGI
jgi:hypothetical protein